MDVPTPIPTPVENKKSDSEVPIPLDSVPRPTLAKVDFFSSEKKIMRFARFLMIAGIGALWLTYWWYEAQGSEHNFGYFPVLYYYIFNSVMLFLLGIFLYLKEFKAYSYCSILLGISVTASLLIFGEGFENPLENLFIYTTLYGIVFGFMYGGIILVPMFLRGVYISFSRGLKHVRGKATYNLS